MLYLDIHYEYVAFQYFVLLRLLQKIFLIVILLCVGPFCLTSTLIFAYLHSEMNNLEYKRLRTVTVKDDWIFLPLVFFFFLSFLNSSPVSFSNISLLILGVNPFSRDFVSRV